jgi:ABC-type Fe3+-siderophore transport system permease subunit
MAGESDTPFLGVLFSTCITTSMPTNLRLHTLQLIAFACTFLVLVALSAFWSIADESNSDRFAVAHAVPGTVAYGTVANSTVAHEAVAFVSVHSEEKTSQPSSTILGLVSKQTWQRYHRLALPVTVGIFFLCFSGWSLTGVENLAIRR